MPGRRSLILAIEIANPGAGARTDAHGRCASGPSVALGELSPNGRTQPAKYLDMEPLALPAAGRFGGHDDDLMPAIDRLLARTRTRDRFRESLSVVAVSVGPGGYTSLRIACAAGKMIAEAAGAPTIAVPTALATLVGTQALGDIASEQATCIALAGKGDTAWLQVFDGHTPREDGRVIAAGSPDLHAALAGVRTLVADRHLPASIRSIAAALHIEVVEPVMSAAGVLACAHMLPEIDPVQLNPVYPREPDAVTLWRARKA